MDCKATMVVLGSNKVTSHHAQTENSQANCCHLKPLGFRKAEVQHTREGGRGEPFLCVMGDGRWAIQ